MRDILIRAVTRITWPINNSTSRKATRRVRRKPKSSRPVRGVDRLVRLLSFASAFKSSALKVLLLSGYLTIFHCDVIIKVSVKVSFPHFGKAGWDCVTEGNINFLLCASVVLSKFLSRRKWPQRYNSQNLSGGILFSLSVFWNSVYWTWNVMNSSEVGEGLLLLRIPYLRQVDDTKKSSCIRRSLSVCDAFNL